MAISKVGLGWPVGERQYTTLAAWVTALKTSGSYEEAWCSGDLGASFVGIGASDFPQGALIRGNVQYTGANHTALAKLPRTLTIASTNGLVVAQDLWVLHGGTTQPTVNISSSNRVSRLYIEHTADPGSNAAILMTTSNAVAENCVVKGTLSTAPKAIRPSSAGIIRNCVGIGTKLAILSEWTNSKTEKSYGVGASIASYHWPNGRPPGNVTNASEDSSGDVGFQNLNPTTNFVDYANGDYRIRASSPLHAAGIGAFFEESTGGTEYPVSINTTYAGYSASVEFTNTRPINTVAITATYASYAAEVNSTNSKPIKSASIVSTYPNYTASISATGGVVTYNSSINTNYPKYVAIVAIADVNKLSVSTSYPAYTSNVNSTNTKPVKTTTVNASYPAYTVSSSFTAVPQGFSFAVNTTYPVYIANSNLTNIDPIDTVSILATYAMYSASALLDSDLPSKTVSIVGTYPNYSVSVLVGSESTDKDLSINASYPKYIGTVVIGEFLSLPYRGGAGAHLNVSLGLRDVIFKEKNREVKWRVENARL